jgi:hypothetical protein
MPEDIKYPEELKADHHRYLLARQVREIRDIALNVVNQYDKDYGKETDPLITFNAMGPHLSHLFMAAGYMNELMLEELERRHSSRIQPEKFEVIK